MKKVNLLIATVALIGATTIFISCSDDDNGNIIGGDDVVNSDEEAFALVNSGFQAYQDLCSTFTMLSDVATQYGSTYMDMEDDSALRLARLLHDETNDYPVWAWDDFYWSIGIANDAIEKISASIKVSSAAKKESIARAKFIRALSYSYLVLYFGEVPIRLTVNDENTTRASIDAVYTQIESDLLAAEEGLPETSSTPVIPTKGAAQALLSRIYLQWGSNPLSHEEVAAIQNSTTDPAPAHNETLLNKAITYADKVISSQKYDLKNNFNALFGRANESQAPEHIFTIQQDGDGIDILGNHQYHCAWTYPFQTSKVSHIHPISTFEDWSDDDPRKAFSIVTSITDPKTGNVYSYKIPETMPVFGKGVDRSYANSEWETIEKNDVDQIEIRYAEVLLNKAEALVVLGRNSDGSADKLINRLRKRAYGDESHGVSNATLKDVQDEWLHEFIYEHKQWQNQVRWRTLISSLKNVKYNFLYDDEYATAGSTTSRGVVSTFAARDHAVLRAKYENANGHLYRYPIPIGLEGEDLGVKPQNPGY